MIPEVLCGNGLYGPQDGATFAEGQACADIKEGFDFAWAAEQAAREGATTAAPARV